MRLLHRDLSHCDRVAVRLRRLGGLNQMLDIELMLARGGIKQRRARD